jgi:hypothetical protein
VLAAETAGVLDRVITVFADLGPDEEWPGTQELAAGHAAFYGLPHQVVLREITLPDIPVAREAQNPHPLG